MRTIECAAGDVLYREGDASDAVYFIEDGEVEVRRTVDADEVCVAVLGKGEILGEMGVIRSAPRSATVVAATPLRLTVVNAPDFLKAFGGPDGLGLKLLRMICARLTRTNASVGLAPSVGKALRSEIDEIRLLGASPEMQALLGPTGVVVGRLPFIVGAIAGDKVRASASSLGLPAARSAGQLQERHFRIELLPNGELALRDLESRLGCIVNGRRISNFERFELGPVKELEPGDNTVTAGGQYSSVRFVVRLRRRLAKSA